MRTLNRSKTVILVTLVVSIGVAVICRGSQQESVQPFDTARSKIKAYLQEARIASISVAVAKDGKILWEESFGWADVEKQIKATPHTMYHLGSLGKVYTATAIMILKERGLVDLDAQANDYLGEARIEAYEGNVAAVTLRRILNHTSGLPYMWTHLYADDLSLRPSLDEVIRRFGKTVAPPGDRYMYSNLGFGILGHIVERISGRPYHEFLRTELLRPLGLTRTSVDTGLVEGEFIAQKYASNKRVPYFDMICKGGGTAYASAHDLVRFGMFHLGNHLQDQRPVLSDSSIQEMQSSSQSASSQSPYRIGWWISSRFGYSVVQHGGHVIGAKADLKLLPSENIAIAVHANGEEASVTKVGDWILSDLLPRYKVFSAVAGIFSGSGSSTKRSFVPPLSLAGTWTGEIRTCERALPVRLVIEAGGQVRMKYLDAEDPGALEVTVRDSTVPKFENGIFTATFPLEIPTTFVLARYPHMIEVNAKLRGSTLSGCILACALQELPHFNLPLYIRLEKAKE